MAYEPKEWVCGEYVTADGLNNLEEGVQEALAKDCGYSCSEEEVERFNGTITTELFNDINVAMVQGTQITADSIRVVFDGVSYDLDIDANGNYGASNYDISNFVISFADYPFLIFWYSAYNVEAIATETAGTHTVEIYYGTELVATTTECFRTAVKSATNPLIFTLEGEPTYEPCEGIFYTYSHSWQEVHDAFMSGRPCIVRIVNGGCIFNDLVIGTYSCEGEYSITTRLEEYHFDDPTSKTHVECDTQ